MKEVKKEDLTYRMYGFVPYNISEIQKGIQFGHAVVEYGLEYGQNPEYQKWAREDKTFIILNGGTTNNMCTSPTSLPIGTLNQLELHILASFPELNIARFSEPDLGDQLTAICFLVDERVWDRERYPNFEHDRDFGISYIGQYKKWEKDTFGDCVDIDDIIKMRNLLKKYKLA